MTPIKKLKQYQLNKDNFKEGNFILLFLLLLKYIIFTIWRFLKIRSKLNQDMLG